MGKFENIRSRINDLATNPAHRVAARGKLEEIKEILGKAVIDGFAGLTPDLRGIDRDARNQTRNQWQSVNTAMVGIGGGLFNWIPGLHLVGIIPDVLLLVNRMAVTSYGIGAIMAKERGLPFCLEKQDMDAILTRWCGDPSLSDEAVAAMTAKGGAWVAAGMTEPIFAKFALEHAGVLAGKKLGGKVATKVATKFKGKYAGKLVGGIVPIAGPAICAGINVWFITQMCDAAAAWYGAKFRLAYGAKGIDPTSSAREGSHATIPHPMTSDDDQATEFVPDAPDLPNLETQATPIQTPLGAPVSPVTGEPQIVDAPEHSIEVKPTTIVQPT